MKYSATVLLTFLGLTASSVLPQQGRSLRRSYYFSSTDYNNNNFDNNGNYNNNNNYNNHNSNRNNNYNGQGNQQFIEKQQAIIQLLSNLDQSNPSNNFEYLGRNFNPYRNANRFYSQKAVGDFLRNFENHNFLPRDEVFSPTSQEHQNQAAQLFNFFYSAQDWSTLKQAAAWAKQRFNPDLFAYAFTAAVLNHPATQGVVVPALYEIIPHAFVPATAIQQIYNAKFQGQRYATVYANYTNQNQNNKNYYNYNQNKYNNNNNFRSNSPQTVFAENDGSQQNNAGVEENPENRVSYFTEDVGVNAFHAGFHTQNPPFLGSNNNNNFYDSLYRANQYNSNNNNNKNKYYNYQAIRRGEEFYFTHQQLYARYVLERLSNNLPIPQPINFNDKIEPGYNPNLEYANGQAVPARPPNTYFQQQQNENSNNNNYGQQPNNNQAENPQVYEQRLQEAAESGYVVNEDGSQTKLNDFNGIGVLANLAAAPANSPNSKYYGDYFSSGKNAIGNIIDPNNQNGVAPGAVANYATAARDPAYYQFLAKLNQIFRNFQNKQGPYRQNQLSFSGVQIESFDVSRLITFFDVFNVNVNNVFNRKQYNKNYLNNNNENNKYYPNNNNNTNNHFPNNNNNYPNNYNNNNNYPNNNNNNYNNNNFPNNNNPRKNHNNNYYPNNNQNGDNNYPNNNNNYPNNYNNYPNNYNGNDNSNYPNKNNENYPSNYNNGDYNVKFQRLTNKPFNYRLKVRSQRSANAMVRVFIGPKYDANGQQFTLPQASQYFVQLDHFKVQLNNGVNVIERNSQQSSIYIQEKPSFQQLWNQVSQGQQVFYNNQVERRYYGFPQRSQLPKGKEEGQEFVFYAIITEADSNSDNVNDNYNNNSNINRYNDNNNNNNNENNFDNNYNDHYNNGDNYNYSKNYRNYVQDNKSVGFPFDRPVQDANYNTPNQYFKTVKVYHKTQNNY